MNTKIHLHRFCWLNTLIISLVISFLFCMLLIETSCSSHNREQARRQKCMNNLKQIGLGMKQYANDCQETMLWGDASLQPFQYMGKLHPAYASALEVFRCPDSRDSNWDVYTAHLDNKDNAPFTEDSCKKSLSYAYGTDKHGFDNDGKGPWTETATSTTRLAADKYACADYSKGNIRNKPSNHNTEGRNVVCLDGSAHWDNSKKPLEADPDTKYPSSSNSPESDQTGTDWWSDPPDKR